METVDATWCLLCFQHMFVPMSVLCTLVFIVPMSSVILNMKPIHEQTPVPLMFDFSGKVCFLSLVPYLLHWAPVLKCGQILLLALQETGDQTSSALGCAQSITCPQYLPQG